MAALWYADRVAGTVQLGDVVEVVLVLVLEVRRVGLVEILVFPRLVTSLSLIKLAGTHAVAVIVLS